MELACNSCCEDLSSQKSWKNKKTAFFATCIGRAGKCLKQMKELYDSEILTEKVILKNEIEENTRAFMGELIQTITACE